MTKISILGDKMKINNLHITNVGNISDLDLNFNPRMNVICGTNGIGKTTILNSIAACFSVQGNNLKKNMAVK
ncbi:AAA family ATPase [Enterococcus faecium]